MVKIQGFRRTSNMKKRNKWEKSQKRKNKTVQREELLQCPERGKKHCIQET